MRNIVVMASVSLDGYMAGPNDELDWHLISDEVHTHFNELLDATSLFIEGRRSHELMAAAWPTLDQDPDAPPVMAEFARIWREKPKLVYSRTLDRVDWNATLVREVVPDDIRALKSQPGGDIAIGGPDLVRSFAAHDLVDEYRLYLTPVVLGAGKPMFPPMDHRTHFTLLETRTFANDVVLVRYGRR